MHHCSGVDSCVNAVAEHAQQVAGWGVGINLAVFDYEDEPAQTAH